MVVAVDLLTIDIITVKRGAYTAHTIAAWTISRRRTQQGNLTARLTRWTRALSGGGSGVVLGLPPKSWRAHRGWWLFGSVEETARYEGRYGPVFAVTLDRPSLLQISRNNE